MTMASAISLWHSSRYKTLILTICAKRYMCRCLPEAAATPPSRRRHTQQVARCATVHSAGSQLPLRVLGMYLCRAPETTRRRAEIGDQALTGRTSLL